MQSNPTISEVILSKPWISEGAVRHNPRGQAKDIYYPKVGMQFIARKVAPVVIPTPHPRLKKYIRNGAGFDEVEFDVPEHRFTAIKFDINQNHEGQGGMVPIIDPATKKPTVLLDDDYVTKFEGLVFIERHGVLISRPIILPKEGDVAVSFIIDLFTDDKGRVYMLQNSYWNSSYFGTYCCG